jgi:hypothetical protein
VALSERSVDAARQLAQAAGDGQVLLSGDLGAFMTIARAEAGAAPRIDARARCRRLRLLRTAGAGRGAADPARRARDVPAPQRVSARGAIEDEVRGLR